MVTGNKVNVKHLLLPRAEKPSCPGLCPFLQLYDMIQKQPVFFGTGLQ